MNLRARLQSGVFFMDGAMGTQIQARGIPSELWAGHEGCNEFLNLAAPEIIRSIHEAYLAAGCDAVETNTFGGSPITLGEYGLSDRAREINRAGAALAREAAHKYSTPEKPRFVFGSIGPGTRLPSLGQVTFDELVGAFRIQMEGLLEGGADGLLLETCQDLLQIKAGLAAFQDVVGSGGDVPLYVSVTVEQTGTLLTGSNIATVVAVLGPFPIDVLGLNCATGPEAMRIHLDYLAAHWPGKIGCMPNAGLPVMEGTRVRYPLGPEEFAEKLAAMAQEVNLDVVGGCCGTTPDHLRALIHRLATYRPRPRQTEIVEQVASLFQPVDLTQRPPPLYIGERANATGSKQFREALLRNDYDAAFAVLIQQEEQSAHVLDLSCAYAGRDEERDMSILVARAARECRAPLMLDSTQPNVLEAGLKRYGGRAILNSINFEGGEDKARQIVGLARRYGAALVGLTIDEQGMAMTTDRKVAIARRLVEFCEKHGVPRQALLVDTLTFTLGSGDPALRTAAIETIEAIRQIKREMPGVRTILGISNISYGLKPAARQVLNSVFLTRCLQAGLDACIVNVAALASASEIPPEAQRLATALLENDHSHGDPLEAFIRYFESAPVVTEAAVAAVEPPDQRLKSAVIRGRSAGIGEAIEELLRERTAEQILNDLLIPAMQEVGRLFNDGLLQLPFVLKSAEVMKASVDLLKPHLRRSEGTSRRLKMVIATVAGDVHDIGKNLVDIILSNNGFEVINLGTKVPVEQMIAAVREHQADALGMSGLLVKSALMMAENLKALEAAGMKVPVLLGGAALTAEFVARECQPLYSAPVRYCKDAFEGLARMRELAERGRLDRTPPVEAPSVSTVSQSGAAIVPVAAPRPPFYGHRIVRDIPIRALYPLLNEVALVRGRWGYRRGRLSAEEYNRLIREQVLPRLELLKAQHAEGALFRPQVAYGWFRCRSEGETLWVYSPEESAPFRLVFPRQRHPPYWSIPDFFRRDEDVVGFMVVTLGGELQKEEDRLLKADRYEEYLLLHGFAVELTDALAEYWHAQMRAELGFRDPPLTPQDYVVQNYRGSRYGFGYPACPDLAMHRVCCRLVHADEIGVTLTESDMMIPEVSTAALVAHHPQAKYFDV